MFTGIPGWTEEADWSSFGCNAIDRAWLLEFTVAARRWDEPLDLEALVERLAVASGMGRAYAEWFHALIITQADIPGCAGYYRTGCSVRWKEEYAWVSGEGSWQGVEGNLRGSFMIWC